MTLFDSCSQPLSEKLLKTVVFCSFVNAVRYFECHSSHGAWPWAGLSFISCCFRTPVCVDLILLKLFLFITIFHILFLVFYFWMITFVVWSISSSEEHVVKRGEELLKKKTTGANLNDLNLIKRLFLLFLLRYNKDIWCCICYNIFSFSPFNLFMVICI
jgi:hypothetical protein